MQESWEAAGPYTEVKFFTKGGTGIHNNNKNKVRVNLQQRSSESGQTLGKKKKIPPYH